MKRLLLALVVLVFACGTAFATDISSFDDFDDSREVEVSAPVAVIQPARYPQYGRPYETIQLDRGDYWRGHRRGIFFKAVDENDCKYRFVHTLPDGIALDNFVKEGECVVLENLLVCGGANDKLEINVYRSDLN